MTNKGGKEMPASRQHGEESANASEQDASTLHRRDGKRSVLQAGQPRVSGAVRVLRGTFGHDLIAGLTVAALAIPSGMAYAEMAGLPPVSWVERLGRYADRRLHPRARIEPGVVVYRLDDRLFFANASYVEGRIREAIDGAPSPVRWFVLDAEAPTHVDATGIEALKEMIVSLNDEGITFVMARLKGSMQGILEDIGLPDLVGESHIHPTVRAAVEGGRLEHGGVSHSA